MAVFYHTSSCTILCWVTTDAVCTRTSTQQYRQTTCYVLHQMNAPTDMYVRRLLYLKMCDVHQMSLVLCNENDGYRHYYQVSSLTCWTRCAIKLKARAGREKWRQLRPQFVQKLESKSETTKKWMKIPNAYTFRGIPSWSQLGFSNYSTTR